MEFRGTRAEVRAELRALATGWDHLAKPDKSADASAALAEIDAGASSVQAGHTNYTVTDDTA